MNPLKLHLMIDGESKGPYTIGQLRSMWDAGTVTSETLHFMDGYSDWMPLDLIVSDYLEAPHPPMLPQSYPMYSYATAARLPQQPLVLAKSRGVYIILALFLGGLFGVHNFYAGRYGSAVAQLLITILTFWLVVPLVAVALWVLVECLAVTKDGRGMPMS